jgi:phosphoenolpyruvate carboxykinase (GTP)
MLILTVPGWKVVIGDDISDEIRKDGRLYAINPEAGFFGVAPGTWDEIESQRDAYSNEEFDLHHCALTPDNDVWWEGMTEEKPSNLIDWLRRPWTPRSGRPAHPNARLP